MIELQIINKIIANKSLAIVRQNNVTPEYFAVHKEEFMFITEHYNEYGNVPDIATVLKKYPDFDNLDVGESDRYLIEKLNEQYLCSKMLPVLFKIRDFIEEKQADKAFTYARQEFMAMVSSTGFKPGYDIVANAQERKAEFERRQALKGLLGISSGIKEMDDLLHGWLPGEDFISIVGRTNEGKSWVLLFFLVMAWKAGNPVLLYSGEMSELMVGFRFDTLYAHFKNEGLMSGGNMLGSPDLPLTVDDYTTYVKNLSTNDVPFIVVTPKHLGRKMTIPDLHLLIETYKPKLIGLDQLSLMEDYRAKPGEQPRIRFTHLAEDIYTTSEKYGIPIMSPSQASREAAKESKKNIDAAPELDQIGESDGIGQNATRVVSIKQIGATLKMSIKKNRYGKNNIDFLFAWDIDHGTIRPIIISTPDGSKQPTDGAPISGEELF